MLDVQVCGLPQLARCVIRKAYNATSTYIFSTTAIQRLLQLGQVELYRQRSELANLASCLYYPSKRGAHTASYWQYPLDMSPWQNMPVAHTICFIDQKLLSLACSTTVAKYSRDTVYAEMSLNQTTNSFEHYYLGVRMSCLLDNSPWMLPMLPIHT